MKIKLTQSWLIDGSVEMAGAEIDLPDNEAIRLLNQGKAVALKETKERAVKPGPTEKAVRE